jgi:hypothetical protein
MPLLSVVIPTLDRPDTLHHALTTLRGQQGTNCEFIIQNNGGNAEIAALLDAIDDPRFRHFTTPGIVTMTENWELALGHATGDYVTFIGDDDGLMPDACEIAASILERAGPELLSWAPYAYYWPGYYHAEYRNRLVAAVNFRFIGDCVVSRDELARFYGFQAHYSRLPMIYNSFVRRDVIERVRARAGRYFLGLSPDVTSGIANAALSAGFLRLSRPLSISGLSQHSTGHTNFFEKTGELGSSSGRRDFGAIAKDPTLPDLDALPLFLANDMLLVKALLFPADPAIALNYRGLAQAIATDINDRPEIYDRTLQSIRDLVALNDLDLAEIIVPARQEDRPPLGTGVEIQGSNRVQFRLDGAALGLKTIADAVRVMAQFVPGQVQLDRAWRPAEAGIPVLDSAGLDVTRAGGGAAALVEGWGEPEDWGTWSAAKTCRLRFRLDPLPVWPVVIEFACHAFVSARNPALQVSCRVGQTAPQDWAFSTGSAKGGRSLLLDPAGVGSDGVVTITFRLSTPRSPADLGLGADVRPLGIGLQRMWIAA